jgi:hypothetical protein
MGSAVCPEAVKARLQVLQGLDEAVAAFAKLQDVDGVHYCAKLAWNAGVICRTAHFLLLVTPLHCSNQLLLLKPTIN